MGKARGSSIKYPPMPRLRRVIRLQRNPPKQQYFSSWIILARFTHSSKGKARCLLRRRININNLLIQANPQFIIEKPIFFFKWILRINLKGVYGISILMKLNWLRRTLVHAGPAFDTIFWMDRVWFILLDFIDLARADLSTITATITFILVNNGIHSSHKKSEILISKSETNPKFEFQNLKIFFRPFVFWTLVLISNFVLRISNLLLTDLFRSTG